MGPRSQRRAQRLEQSIVAEPAVGHHQDRGPGEDPRQTFDQTHRLGKLALKDHGLAPHPDTAGPQGLQAQIEGKGQRQTAPAPVDHLQQPHGDNRLRPGVLALVGLGGMVEGVLTAKHLASGLGVDGNRPGRTAAVPRSVGLGSPARAPPEIDTECSFTEAMNV